MQKTLLLILAICMTMGLFVAGCINHKSIVTDPNTEKPAHVDCREIILAFPLKNKTDLRQEKRMIVVNDNRIEELILREFLAGPKEPTNCGLMPPETKVESINIQKTTANIRFSEAFAAISIDDPFEIWLIEEAILQSLQTSLEHIDKVVIEPELVWSQPYRIIVDNEWYSSSTRRFGKPPRIMIREDIIYVPINTASSCLGFEYEWCEELKKLELYKENMQIEFDIITNDVLVDAKRTALCSPAIEAVGTVYIPLQFVSTTLGMHYIAKDDAIFITTHSLLTVADVAPLEQDKAELERRCIQLDKKRIDIDDNYCFVMEDNFPYVALIKKGRTTRGVCLGNSSVTVQQIYGKPYRTTLDETGTGNLVYLAVGYTPQSGDYQTMVCFFKDNILTELRLTYPL